jgi:membrane protease YdiL (CAAX protease family)
MRRVRTIGTLLVAGIAMLVLAPDALATAHNGEGFWGETSDRTITYAMYIVIVFFPTVIVVFSLIQGHLEKRKHAKLVAEKRRASNIDWRGGW